MRCQGNMTFWTYNKEGIEITRYMYNSEREKVIVHPYRASNESNLARIRFLLSFQMQSQYGASSIINRPD